MATPPASVISSTTDAEPDSSMSATATARALSGELPRDSGADAGRRPP